MTGPEANRHGLAAMMTPCVKLCVFNAHIGLCEGCGRTLDEIAGWASLDERSRRSIMRELPRRLAAHRPAALSEAEA